MTSSKNYITTQGYEKLRSEMHELFHVERPKVVETVAWAASNGDRSENGDYIYGKKRLRQIDSRIHFLKRRIEAAEVVNPNEIDLQDRVVFGVTVQLENESGEQHTYQIVGEDEIDTSSGKISWKAPLARALLGKAIGEVVSVRLPKGEVEYEILDIYV